MGVAFRAPRALIERPKPPSSRFSFYRRRYSRIKGGENTERRRRYEYNNRINTALIREVVSRPRGYIESLDFKLLDKLSLVKEKIILKG